MPASISERGHLLAGRGNLELGNSVKIDPERGGCPIELRKLHKAFQGVGADGLCTKSGKDLGQGGLRCSVEIAGHLESAAKRVDQALRAAIDLFLIETGKQLAGLGGGPLVAQRRRLGGKDRGVEDVVAGNIVFRDQEGGIAPRQSIAALKPLGEPFDGGDQSGPIAHQPVAIHARQIVGALGVPAGCGFLEHVKRGRIIHFRAAEAIPGIVEEAKAIKPKVLWMQLGIRHEAAGREAEAAGMTVIMDRCPKIEYGRLMGEIGWLGVKTKVISSKRKKRI